MKTIECKEKGCDQTREVIRTTTKTVMMCEEHYQTHRRAQEKQATERHNKRNPYIKKQKSIRLDCRRCDGHRTVSYGMRYRAVHLCSRHLKEYFAQIARAKQNGIEIAEKPLMGLKVVSGGGLFYSRILPAKTVVEMLEDGYYPDDIVFEDTISKERYTVERVGDSQKLVEV